MREPSEPWLRLIVAPVRLPKMGARADFRLYYFILTMEAPL